MSSSLSSQSRTAELVKRLPHKVIGAYGLHPWFSHSVSLVNDHPKQSIESERRDGLINFEALPSSISFESFMFKLRERLLDDPDSLLGEVGLDKAFRIKSPGKSTPSHMKVPMSHQRAVLEAQLDLAVEIGKHVSLHAVQCPNEIIEVLEQLQAKWGEKLIGSRTLEGEGLEGGIKICWHSASISIETLNRVLNLFPNFLYFSYSIVLFEGPHLNQKLDHLLRHTPDDRLLIESDWSQDPNLIDDQIDRILHCVMLAKGWSVEEAIDRLERNWTDFSRSPATLPSLGSGTWSGKLG